MPPSSFLEVSVVSLAMDLAIVSACVAFSSVCLFVAGAILVGGWTMIRDVGRL